eukprot:gene10946-3018_t
MSIVDRYFQMDMDTFILFKRDVKSETETDSDASKKLSQSPSSKHATEELGEQPQPQPQPQPAVEPDPQTSQNNNHTPESHSDQSPLLLFNRESLKTQVKTNSKSKKHNHGSTNEELQEPHLQSEISKEIEELQEPHLQSEIPKEIEELQKPHLQSEIPKKIEEHGVSNQLKESEIQQASLQPSHEEEARKKEQPCGSDQTKEIEEQSIPPSEQEQPEINNQPERQTVVATIIRPYESPYEMDFLLQLEKIGICKNLNEETKNHLKDLGLLKGHKTYVSSDSLYSSKPRESKFSLTDVGKKGRAGRRVGPRGSSSQGPATVTVMIPDNQIKFESSENAFKRGQQGLIGDLRSALGKVTLDNFDDITKEIINLLSQVVEGEKQNGSRIDKEQSVFFQFVTLLHETACDSEFFSVIYAKLSKRLINAKTEKVDFRFPKFKPRLFDECTRAAQSDIGALDEELKKLHGTLKRLNTAPGSAPSELEKVSDELYLKNRKRQKLVGNAVFVAELFNENMLNHKDLKEYMDFYWKCFQNHPTDDSVLCICKIIEKAGCKLEKSCKNLLEETFQELQNDNCQKKVASKIKFSIMDLVDLRKTGWKKIDNAPRSKDQIQAEVQAQQQQKTKGYTQQQRNIQPVKRVTERYDANKVGIDDIPTLQRNTSRPRSRFSKNKESPTQRQTPSQHPVSVKPANRYLSLPTDTDIPDSVVEPTLLGTDNHLIERKCRATIEDNKEAYSCIKELGDEHQTTFMSQLIKVLFGNLKDERKSYETLLENAVSEGILSKQHIIESITKECDTLEEISLDVPKAPYYLATVASLAVPNHDMIQLLKDLKISKHTHFSLVVDYLHVLKERQGRAASRYAFKLLGADLSGFHMTGNVQIIEKQLDRKGLLFLVKSDIETPSDVSRWQETHPERSDSELGDIVADIVVAIHFSSPTPNTSEFFQPLKGTQEERIFIDHIVNAAQGLGFPKRLLSIIFDALIESEFLSKLSLTNWQNESGDIVKKADLESFFESLFSNKVTATRGTPSIVRDGVGMERQSVPSLVVASLVGVLLLSLLKGSEAKVATLSIDFGTEWIKAGIVKPGVPMDIVLNRESKRKTPNVIGIRNGERTFGLDALAVSVKHPQSAFRLLPTLLGQKVDSAAVERYRDIFPEHTIEADPLRKTVCFRMDEDTIYTVEELVAMILAHTVELGSEYAGQPISSVVIVVPSFYGQPERIALLTAAEIANIQVTRLVNAPVAVGLNYGVFRRTEFNSTEQLFLFYDMGSTSTIASIIGFHTVKDKETKKQTPALEVKSVGFDQTLGGFELDLRLQKYLLEEFKRIHGSKLSKDVTSNARAMSKLLAEAQKVKTVLSVNTETTAQVEGVFEGYDLKTHVTRSKLEELGADLFQRVQNPVISALSSANLTLGDISSFIIIGGSVRIPKVQEVLTTMNSGIELGKKLNGDEACALGAAYEAAALSKAFRVKKFITKDANTYPIEVQYKRYEEDEDGEESEPKTVIRSLFPRNNPVPQKKILTLTRHKDDFMFSTSYGSLDFLLQKKLFRFEDISTVFVTGVAAVLSNHSDDASKGVKVHFKLDESSILQIDKVEAHFEVQVNVTVSTNRTDTTDAAHTEQVVADDNTISEDEALGDKYQQQSDGLEGNTNANDDEKTNTDEPSASSAESEQSKEEGTEDLNSQNTSESDDSSSGSLDNANGTSTTPQIITKIKTLKVPLNFSVVRKDIIPMTAEQIAAAKSVLESFSLAEYERAVNEEARNRLESFVFETKDKLWDDEFIECSTEEEREALQDILSILSDWLDFEADDANATIFNDKLDSLNSTCKDIFQRVHEKSHRPVAIAQLRESLNRTRVFVATVRNVTSNQTEGQQEWIKEEELAQLEALANSTQAWLGKKIAEQNEMKPYENPTLKVSTLVAKANRLDRETYALVKRPPPKPKKPSKKKSNTTKNADEADASTSGSSGNANPPDGDGSSDDDPKSSKSDAYEDEDLQRAQPPSDEKPKVTNETDTINSARQADVKDEL